MTQDEIASQLNVSTVTYRNYETGRRDPTPETLVKLSEIYECSVDEILKFEYSSSLKDKQVLLKKLKELQLLIDEIIKDA